ncbi:Methyltransferase domain [Carpediemonas membranifera]|uniref:Methyltransferase domain n=1 Tax=Carpediemonas membranifera TaxID=201153 RepID=A0A8J6B7U0_9EUKA|nr:Methyltransferase domain [Carpediemonas membranifera]|eukprot:KAG9396049.1 Methyltransferase domain [Carpediemonas membranifera]
MDTNPSKELDHSKKAYWDDRFSKMKNTADEWLLSAEDAYELVHPFFRPESEILDLGCGLSALARLLFDKGFHNLTCIDFSHTAVTKAANRAEGRTVEHSVMDTTHLYYPSETFDVVIDKGTLDSVLCGSDSFVRASATLQEVYRVLKPNGFFISISQAPPEQRMNHLSTVHLPWEVRHKEVKAQPGPDVVVRSTKLHVYLCTRPGPRSESLDS